MAIKITERNDYSYLFNSLNNNKTANSGSNIFNSINLSEYSSIKSGAYSKALKAYFAKEVSDTESSSSDKKNSVKESTQSTAVEKLTDVANNASALEESAKKLTTKSTDSLFLKKEMTVKAEDGTKTTVEDYDVDAIYNAVSDFTKKYNSLLTSMGKADSDTVKDQIDGVTMLVGDYESALKEVGITTGKDDTLSVDKDTFKKADMDEVKKLFNGNASFAYLVSKRAAYVGAEANREANVMKNYDSNGNYDNSLGTGNILDSII